MWPSDIRCAFEAAALSLALLAAGCGPAAPSVYRFGDATLGFSEGMEATARGSAGVCERKQDLDLDQRVALGEADAKAVLTVLNADSCATFRETGELYARLAQQLGAFGLALRTLAEAGEQDYSEHVSQLTASASVLGSTGIKKSQLDAAGGLVDKLLSWFTQGYSRTQIAKALVESEGNVTATLDLLGLVLEAYKVQLNGYSELIHEVGEDRDFTEPREGEAEAPAARRRLAQIDLVKVHKKNAQETERLLAASEEALASLRSVHRQLVQEAKQGAHDFKMAQLVASAQKLSGEVTAFRRLVRELVPG